jgi:hypothetical protein
VRWKRSAGYAPSSQQRDQKSSNPTRILTQKLWYGIGTIFIIRTPKKNSATARTTTTDLTNKMVDVDRERWYITVRTDWLAFGLFASLHSTISYSRQLACYLITNLFLTPHPGTTPSNINNVYCKLFQNCLEKRYIIIREQYYQ